MNRLRKFSWTVLAVLPVIVSIPLASQMTQKSTAQRPKPVQALSQDEINFIRPGVVVKIVSASIAKDGTITARVNLTDPKGLPLDRTASRLPAQSP